MTITLTNRHRVLIKSYRKNMQAIKDWAESYLFYTDTEEQIDDQRATVQHGRRFAADLLWLCCRDQAEERNVSEADFGRSLGGLTLFAARNAFIDEYIDFFPDPTVQENLRTVRQQTDDLRKTAMQAFLKEANRKIEKLKETISGTIASELQQLAESPTTGTGPSGN